MARFVVAMCAAGALGLAAAAQTPASDPAIAIVDQAVDAAVARDEPDQRWAFTRTITFNGDTFSARYDPSRPAGEEWVLLAPASEGALSEELAGVLESLRMEPVSDQLIMVGEPGENYGVRLYVDEGLALSTESSTQKRYVFQPRDNVGLMFPPLGGGLQGAEHLNGELLITTSEPTLASLRIYASEPFKPNPAARVDTVDILWRFGEVAPGGPIAILESDTMIAGKALFRGFSTESVVVNSDFERVAAAADD